jgi:hypothetical protein
MNAYKIYQAAMLEQDCGTDPWESLPEIERAAWEVVERTLTRE